MLNREYIDGFLDDCDRSPALIEVDVLTHTKRGDFVDCVLRFSNGESFVVTLRGASEF